MRQLVAWAVCVTVCALSPLAALAAEKGTCAACHTNPETLRALVVAPKLQVEGEG